ANRPSPDLAGRCRVPIGRKVRAFDDAGTVGSQKLRKIAWSSLREVGQESGGFRDGDRKIGPVVDFRKRSPGEVDPELPADSVHAQKADERGHQYESSG